MKGHYYIILFLFLNLAEYFCENMMRVCGLTSAYFLWYKLWQLWHITTPLSWLKYMGFVLLHLIMWWGSSFSLEPQMIHSLWFDKRSLAQDCSFQYFCDDCIFNSIINTPPISYPNTQDQFRHQHIQTPLECFCRWRRLLHSILQNYLPSILQRDCLKCLLEACEGFLKESFVAFCDG